MKYKVGDKVRVRSDLKIYDKYSKYVVIKEMKKLSGKVITIADCLWDSYRILEDNRVHGWTDEMFEEIKEDKMDNNTLQININNLTDEERATLLSLVKKANKSDSKVWKPEYDMDYYFIRNNGQICYTNWIKSDIDKERFILGNCFKTEEEAEFALERQKVITELKRYMLENNEKEIDWYDHCVLKYYIQYDYVNDTLNIASTRYYKNNISSMYFTSDKIAQAAIKEIGEDRLKKFYFEVSD